MIFLPSTVCLLLFFASAVSDEPNGGAPGRSLYPIILVPGYMGSQLYAKIERNADVPIFCLRRPAIWTLWLSMKEFIPILNQCWLYSARLQYDPVKRNTYNSKGVKVIVPDFRGLDSIEILTPGILGLVVQVSYFEGLIGKLVNIGYRREVDLFGAPYDWRKSMNEQAEWFRLMKELVEKTFAQNGNRKVILLGHSMGGSMIYVFLQQQSQEWKNKYVRLFFPLATPFIGNFKYLYDYLFDDDYPATFSRVIRKAERTFPSMAFLVPKGGFWDANTVFISAPNRNYTPANYEQFFNDIGQPTAYQMLLDVAGLQGDLRHPNVDIFCFGGSGQKTLRALVAETSDLYNKERRQVIYGEGDGFVNIESLKSCLRWSSERRYQFKYQTFDSTHLGLIRDSEVTEKIAREILSLT